MCHCFGVPGEAVFSGTNNNNPRASVSAQQGVPLIPPELRASEAAHIAYEYELAKRRSEHAKALGIKLGVLGTIAAAGLAGKPTGPRLTSRDNRPRLNPPLRGGKYTTPVMQGSDTTPQTSPPNAGQAFTVEPRVVRQLADTRLGQHAGKITPQRLHDLVNSPLHADFSTPELAMST